jgi:MerR HTH family regulatory protein
VIASAAGGTPRSASTTWTLSRLKPAPPGADVQDMVDKSDLLRPVDIATRVRAVLFTVGQVCTIAGITKMQLDLWTERASIGTLGVKQRLYDANAVEHVMLIAQARDLGFSVDAAIEAAAAFRARAGGDQPGRIAA